MPITEVPTQPAGAPPEPPRKSKRARYDSLEHHELLQVMDDMQDERARARLREVFWISIIVHMIVFWFLLYGPKYVWSRHIRVVDPSTILKERDKQLTYLNLPPDALKQVKPKQSNIISDKNRVAESKNPTLDKKTLRELEAMKRAGPPAPAPPAPQMGQTPQQQAQAAPPPPQPMPKQRPTQPLQTHNRPSWKRPSLRPRSRISIPEIPPPDSRFSRQRATLCAPARQAVAATWAQMRRCSIRVQAAQSIFSATRWASTSAHTSVA
jgi:hypothetical protein